MSNVPNGSPSRPVDKKAKFQHTSSIDREEVENQVTNIKTATDSSGSDTNITIQASQLSISSKMNSETLGQAPMDLDQKSLNLFSRQNAALGAETTAKLIKMKVLIYGMRGIGVETAKNLALQGVGAMTIVDPVVTSRKDIGCNFFLRESDVGKPRANVVAPQLKELNPICVVVTSESMDESLLSRHSAVVITQPLPLAELLKIDEYCRSRRISFFYAHTGGISADVFVDHGPDHVVNDFNGEKPVQKLITEVTALPGSVSETLVRYETPEGNLPMALAGGHYEITEVTGAACEDINSRVYAVSHDYKDPVKTVRIPYAWKPGMKYAAGGILTEKKIPTKYHMESLASKLKVPGDTFAEPPSLVLTDLINFGSELQQHVAWYATVKFFSSTGRMPTANDPIDAAKVLQEAKDLLSTGAIALGEEQGFELDEAFVTRYASHAGAEMQPMAAFIGGVLAQEVVKSTGKFTPIPGFMHFSAPEALPTDKPSAKDCQPQGSPLDDLAAVYGWKFVEKLGNLTYFMVGCGALGCEFMKNFALNGICCGPFGKLVVTDADRIELSNLSRQFLFREHNVGQPKSRAAAKMAKIMNDKFNVEALELFVGPKTEETFNDDFWQGLSGVCNALDNMEARMYVDQQCVKYEKSLLESGTMGTSGNVDTICPFKTRTYKDGGSAAEGGGVPMCTLRNFPHLTDHCIEWSRDQFELLFAKLGKSCELYLSDPATFEEKIKQKAASEPGAAFFDIRSVSSVIKLVANPSIGGAAQAAFDLFHFLFRDRILDLQAAFPKESRMVDKDTGVDKGPFWGEKKRYPTVAVFDTADPAHTDFVLSATCLFSVMVGLIPPKKEDDSNWLVDYRHNGFIVGIISGLSAPLYIQAPISTEGIDNAPTESTVSIDDILASLYGELRGVTDSINDRRVSFEPADFEKDDDLNFHIAFITSCANLRCDNYSIKRTDFHACKIIAGKIIAAIATTTAAVCGLVMLELFKLVLEKDTDAYMNRAIGLAGFTYTSFTQEPPHKFVTTTVLEMPDPSEKLPDEAYDEKGKLKDEYITKVVKKAYPENHSVWDKLVIDGNMSLKEFSIFLASEHNLKLGNWDFIYGHRTVADENSKDKMVQGATCRLWPPKLAMDYSLVPSLDLTLPQATMAIMKTAAAKPTQQYVLLWREAKAAGVMPPQPPLDEDAIADTMSLVEILTKMSKVAEDNERRKTIDTRAIPSLVGRKFIVIPADEVPLCYDIESGDEIEHMCAWKITL
jgi:ubiquitin-activating enzyme E1